MKIGCSTVVFRRYDLDLALDRIFKAGYRFVEVEGNAPYCDHVRTRENDPVKFRDRVLGFGFSGITCIGSHRELITEPGAEEDIHISLEFAAASGIPVVATGEGRLPDGMKIEEALDRLKPKFERLAETAERCKVYLAIEPHGSLSLSPGGLEKILARAPSPWLSVNFDTANPRRGDYIGIGGEGFGWKGVPGKGVDELAVLRPIVDRVKHLHIKDVVEKNAVILGEGIIRFREIFKLLVDAGYDRAMSFETEGAQDADETQRMSEQSLAFIRRLLDEMGIVFE